jgi:hypothetical protein
MEAVHSASEECVAGLRMTDPGGPFVESMQSAAARIASQIASTSSAPPTRLLNFLIEYRSRNIMLRVPDNETVGLFEYSASGFVLSNKLSDTGKIKVLLESELSIPVDKQDLCGWVSKYNKRIQDSVSAAFNVD